MALAIDFQRWTLGIIASFTLAATSSAAALPSHEEIQSSLENEFRVAPIPQPAGEPGPLARTALELTRRETAALRRDLRAWDKDPRARLLTDGRHTEHGIRPNTELMLPIAVVALWGPEREERAESVADLIAMLRFVAPAHSAGPLTASTDRKWQNQWQSALWAYQAGKAAWMVWDRIDDGELRWLIANMITREADRFVGQEPPHQIKHDTKAEENAWNSTVLALAANMFPDHPRSMTWRETAVRWQLSSLLTEADTRSDIVVDGKPLKEWKLGANVHPDYTLENHGRVHPAYMTVIASLLRQRILYVWAGKPVPEALHFNTREIYDHLKFLSHPDGQLHYPNGQDWELQRVYVHPHTLMSTLFEDREAAFLERIALESVRLMQARTTDGPSLLKREYFFPSLPHAYARFYATSFLAHLYFGEGAEPLTAREFERRVSGVRPYSAGEFLAHRTPAGLVSFSWGNRVMGMAIPFARDLLGTPYELGYVGRIEAEGERDADAPGLPAGTPKVESIDVTHTGDSFGVSASLLRAGDSVEQQIAFVSLEEGIVVYAERLRARRPVNLITLKTGIVGVYNAPEWVHQEGPRGLTWEGGRREVDGRLEMPDFAISSPWLNIDDRWGFIVLTGADGWQYEPEHQIRRGRREQFLFLSPPERLNYEAGGLIAQRATVTLLNHDARSTRALAEKLRASVTWSDDSFELNLPASRIRASFGESRQLEIQ